MKKVFSYVAMVAIAASVASCGGSDDAAAELESNMENMLDGLEEQMDAATETATEEVESTMETVTDGAEEMATEGEGMVDAAKTEVEGAMETVKEEAGDMKTEAEGKLKEMTK